VKVPLKIKVFLWLLKRGSYSNIKIIWEKGIGMVARLVNFVVGQNLSNTYFLIVTTLILYGVWFILFLDPRLRVVLIYSITG
jgi:hypothetical protein